MAEGSREPPSWSCKDCICKTGTVLLFKNKNTPPPKTNKQKNKGRSVQFSCSVVSDSLQPHGLQHARLPCPSPTPGVYSDSCPLSWWCHPTVSSSVVPFSSRLQSFPASESFPMSRLFTSGGQSIGASASASVFPLNIQGWFPLRFTNLIPLLS